MAEQIERHDILDNLLRGPQCGGIRGLEELNKLICRSTESPDPYKEVKRRKKGKGRAKKKTQTKKKTTHYLTREVFENLGDAKEKIKSLLPAGSKRQATKSKIVNTAIEHLLDEFAQKGKASVLAKQILEAKKEKK